MRKTLVFDMDGTIADLYAVDRWLEKLHMGDESPYREAKPMYDMDTLASILILLQLRGWKIAVVSWLAKESDKMYDMKTMLAKQQWLDRYNFPADEIHFVKYGTKKEDCTRHLGGYQILVDDNEDVRKEWTLGDTINAASKDIINKLVELMAAEF